MRIFSTTKSPSCGSSLYALEERRVQLQPRCTLLDDVPHVDHRHACPAARGGELLDVLDHVLLLRVPRRAGLREGSAVDHHVVLKILDDEHRRLGVELERRLVLAHCVLPSQLMYGSRFPATLVRIR
jgi:hypothetical protein